MDMAEMTSQRVMRVIAETQRIPLDHVTADSTFEELKIDSLDGLNILFALEEEFGVDVPDDEGRRFRSVGEVVQGIEQLLARKAT